MKTVTWRDRLITLRYLGMVAVAINLLGWASVSTNAAAQPLKIVAFGDSLTAGYGLGPGQAFPNQLETALKKKGHNVEIINAGVSGDTTGAGLARLDWVIPDDTSAVILELGANDALRGHDPRKTRKNLDAILKKLTAKKLPVLIAGMAAPRNLGSAYIAKFDPIFADLAKKYDQLLYPFFLDGVALNPKLNLPDGLHPTSEGIAVIVERILPSVEKLIARAQSKQHAAPLTSIAQ